MATNFKIGQRVICVNPNKDLIKGKTYLIHHIGISPCCESILLDVGLRLSHLYNGSICGACGKLHEYTDYCQASRFRPLEEEKGTATIE